MEVRDLFIRLRGDDSEAQAALGRIDQNLQRTTQSAQKAADALGKVPEALGKSSSGNFDQIISAFDQISKAGNLTTKDISAAATAFSNLEKAGLSTKGGLSAVAFQLDTLQKSGKVSGEEVAKLQATFSQLSGAGIKSGEDLGKLAGVFTTLTAKHKEVIQTTEQLSTTSIATASAMGAAFGTLLANVLIKLPGALADFARRGDEVNDVTNTFELLNKQVGTLGSDELPRLRVASQGFVSDLDLMKTQAKALQDNLSPAQFEEIVKNVTILSQGLGKDTTEAISKVTEAVTKGRTSTLSFLDISQDDLKKVQAELSKTEEGFNRLSKPAQNMETILKAIQERGDLFGKLGAPGVGDSLEQLEKAFTNLYDRVASGVDNNAEFAESLQGLKTTIDSVRADNIVAALNLVADTASFALKQINNLGIGIQVLFGTTYQGQATRDSILSKGEGAISSLAGAAQRGANFLGSGYPGADVIGAFAGYVKDKTAAASYGFQAKSDDEIDRAKLLADLLEFNPGGSSSTPNRNGTLGSFGEGVDKGAKAAQKALDDLEKKREEIYAKSQQQSDLLGLQKAVDSGDAAGIEAFAAKINRDTSDQLYAGLKDVLAKAGLSRESQQFGEILARTIQDNASKAIFAVNQDIEKNQEQLVRQGIQNQIEDATKNGNLAAVKDLQDQLRNADWRDAYNNSLLTQLKNNVDVEQAKILAAKDADSKIALEDQKNARNLEQLQKQAFQNSVAFFEDLLSSAIDGTGKDLEQTLLEALKKVGIGFASQIGANLFQSLGINLGSINSASGLGQSLAASLGFGGGGVQGVGSLFGGGTLAAAGPALTTSAGLLTQSAADLTAAAAALAGGGGLKGVGGVFQAGSGLFSSVTGGGSTLAGAGAGFGGVSGALPGTAFSGVEASGGVAAGAGSGFAVSGGLSSSTTLLASLGPALSAGAVIIGVGAGAGLLANGISKGGTTGTLSGAAGGGLIGGSLASGLGLGLGLPLGALAAGLFGGQSQASIESQNRKDLLSQFADKFGSTSFGTVSGISTLNPKNFNAPTGDFKNDAATGLAKPLAEIFTGGQGKGTDDLTGIFAHSLNDAQNFNEELLNTSSLLAKMGTNAKDAETTLFQLFKDGKISQNEFADGLQNLETVAQDTFQGKDGIAEGFKAIEKLLGNGTNQGLVGAVQGLSTEMNTFAKQGLKTTQDVANYFSKAGDTLHAKFFQLLSDQGYKTADDLKNALNDPNLFNQLLTDLQGAGDLSQQVGSNAGSAGQQGAAGMKSFTSATNNQIAAQKNLNGEIQKTIDLNNKLANTPAPNSTPTPTSPDENDGGSGGGTAPTGKTRSRVLNRRNPYGR